ncbi:unnamed protein product [Sphagnum troendelagicum]|uniref:Uncharacterized protein n=1 Tax=Sphagnum troendelagicum TaxID=128251 RepID=A0ABP0TAB1_9BRYO
MPANTGTLFSGQSAASLIRQLQRLQCGFRFFDGEDSTWLRKREEDHYRLQLGVDGLRSGGNGSDGGEARRFLRYSSIRRPPVD